MSKRRLDPVDEKLLKLLEKNARQSVVALARGVNLSRTAVQDRLARLEAEGHIAQYTIIRGGLEPGNAVRAVLLVKIETRPCETVLRRFLDWQEILICWSVASPLIDAVILAETENNEQLGNLRERLASVPGVADVSTAPILRIALDRSKSPPG